MFDYPVNVGSEFLTASYQFLGKIIRHNFMSVREDRTLCPFDLELIRCILYEFMPYNLPYFLLTSFEHHYNHKCMGYGLILSHLFKYLGINLTCHKSQSIPNNNIVSHLNLPPKPLVTFKGSNHDHIESHINMFSQVETVSNMNQLMLQN